MRHTTQQIRRRIHYLWAESDPDGIELLSATLSFTFGVVIAYQGNHASILAHPYAYAGLCWFASGCKMVGVLLEKSWLRVLGLLAGTIFWVTLATITIALAGAISWLCFATLAAAQLWAIRRLVNP
jgi:2-keto-4-pentenoate hydratase